MVYGVSTFHLSAKEKSTDLIRNTNPKRKDDKQKDEQSKKQRTMKLERALQAAQATAEPDEDEQSTSESDE